jgi:hypothetical protein
MTEVLAWLGLGEAVAAIIGSVGVLEEKGNWRVGYKRDNLIFIFLCIVTTSSLAPT